MALTIPRILPVLTPPATARIAARRMKLKYLNESSARWVTPTGRLEPPDNIAEGVLVRLSAWSTFTIGVTVQCPDGKYVGSIRVAPDIYDRVLEFLRRHHGCRFSEVMDGEIDISDMVQ